MAFSSMGNLATFCRSRESFSPPKKSFLAHMPSEKMGGLSQEGLHLMRLNAGYHPLTQTTLLCLEKGYLSLEFREDGNSRLGAQGTEDLDELDRSPYLGDLSD